MIEYIEEVGIIIKLRLMEDTTQDRLLDLINRNDSRVQQQLDGDIKETLIFGRIQANHCLFDFHLVLLIVGVDINQELVYY